MSTRKLTNKLYICQTVHDCRNKNELRCIFLSVSHSGCSQQCFNAKCDSRAVYCAWHFANVQFSSLFGCSQSQNKRWNEWHTTIASHRAQNMCAKSAIQQWKWKWLRRQSLVNRICIFSSCRAMCTAPSHLWSRKAKHNAPEWLCRNNCWASALASA